MIAYALIAQLDRVLDYESRGPGFESPWAHQRILRKPHWKAICWLSNAVLLFYIFALL